MKKFKGRITFNVTEGHPDIQYVKNIEEKLSFEDTYTFEDTYDKDSMIDFIKRDLSIVAGGGYDNKHIDNVWYEIEILR